MDAEAKLRAIAFLAGKLDGADLTKAIALIADLGGMAGDDEPIPDPSKPRGFTPALEPRQAQDRGTFYARYPGARRLARSRL